MQFPVTSNQLVSQIETYGFNTTDAQQIVKALEAEGRIELSGSMMSIRNPTDADAQILVGIGREARGATAGSTGANKIHEYLKHTLDNAHKHGSSRRK